MPFFHSLGTRAKTLDRLHGPLSVAGRCRTELRSLRKVSAARYYLPGAKFNHGLMLPRAALVRATHGALFPVAYPNICATPMISRSDATTMLTVLFGAVFV